MVSVMDNASEARPAIASGPTDLLAKHARLSDQLRVLLQDGLIIAFSGGVDSAFLLWAAERQRRESGGRLLALTAVSASMAGVEREDARTFAESLGVEHAWEVSHELDNPLYAVNDSSRCYHCKSELFRIARATASRRLAEGSGYRWLAYGYNATDSRDVRPGHTAALENDVLAPLAASGLGKDDIRALMREHGLALSEKPASPCLSSRLMTGVRVTPAKLNDVEEMESLIRLAGLRVVRVRVHEVAGRRLLRIEVAPEEIGRAIELRDDIVSEGLRRGYQWVTLDLAGYRMGGGVQ